MEVNNNNDNRTMKISVMVECGNDGSYSCYSTAPIGDYGLVDGDGKTVAQAKEDFLKAIEECRKAYPDDERYRNLTFEYRCDLRSFSNDFSHLDVSDIAKRAGISPSLMRQYMSGEKTADEQTYECLSACIEQIKAERCAESR